MLMIIKNIEEELKKLKEIIEKEQEEKENLLKTPKPLDIKNFEKIFNQNIIDLEIEKIKNILKTSEIDEISNLDNELSFDAILEKTIEEFNNICKIKLKATITEIIEKICCVVDKMKRM